MKENFRQSMAWLHTWLGLLFGWLLYFMFVTGTAGYLDTEIDRWMRPELPAARYPLPPDTAVGQAQGYLQAHAAHARRWTLTLPIDRNEPWLRVSWQAARGGSPTASGSAYLDPISGRQIETRDTAGGQTLYQMHWRLHDLPEWVSQWIVSIATLVLLIVLVTGTVVHRGIFADFFTFRPGKGQRSWLDAHNVASVVSLPFQLMITYSGLIFVMFSFMPLIAAAWYGPDRAGQDAFLAMDRHHPTLARRWRGRFARRLLRMIGTASLAGALLCAVADAGLSQGVILWLGVLTPSALLVVGLLAHGFDRHRATLDELRGALIRPQDETGSSPERNVA